ncbi:MULTISPECIES: hypothetical protein [unclassified Paenibacillus]|uniref:hypothetical protein n=1 Tax=unclassified Paenibacillus TaxID=185978 RepID=UPI000954C77F|nr:MULTISPECIES: hypothetical protein [unclassified Paenibacillus]ASS64862.1 hypothetical protein CIC07_01115 [Paenibacillus sp. RUD330]SIR03448.1 hypothetical protein SAMN05880555_2833 [Paenibacillus sp. RU4X]SIR31864.1 hypothetical protein SAMN05880570_3166 [Paenibacillus sp. RU4T]
MGNRYFRTDSRLGIPLPSLDRQWEEYEAGEQLLIIEQWELIRGRIPDLVMAFEDRIRDKQRMLEEEDDFSHSCFLNSEIAELASRINDLHIWYRVNQEIELRRHS